MVTPLDFDDIRRRRQEAIAAAEARLIEFQKTRPVPTPVATPPADPFEGLGVRQTGTARLITGQAPTAPQGFVDAPPEPALATPSEPFGSGVARGVMGAARALNRRLPFEGEATPQNSPFGLEPSLNPIRMATSAIGLSGRVGQRAATQAIAGIQKVIPGRQELEALVDEEIASGKGYIDALDSAFTRAGRSGGLRVPFARTALTPEGSITVNWEDVVAAGFDPIDLALTVGTGGVAKARKVVTGAADRIGKTLTPTPAGLARKQPLAPTPPPKIVGEVPALDTLELQTFGGVDKGLGKVVSPVNPNLAQRIMGAGYKPILRAINPTATAKSVSDRAPIIYEAAAAHGANMAQAGLNWVRAAGDPVDVFKLSREQTVRLGNIKLNAHGEQVYKSKGLSTSEPIALHDIVEFGDTLYEGFTPQQLEVLQRIRRFYQEHAEMAAKEGILETKKGVTPGRQFAEHFGRPGDIFAWAHRAAVGKQIVGPDGTIQDILFNTGKGGSGTKNPFTKTRTYELMQEGLADGMLYANPMEAMEALSSAVYRRIAEKRAADMLERTGQLVTNKQVMSKLYPGVIAQKKAAEAYLAATEANVRRIKRKMANRKAKSPLLTDADDLADDDVIRNGAKYASAINRMQDELIEGMDFLQKSKTAANDGNRRRFRNLYQQRLGRFKAVREEAERIFGEHQVLYRRTLASHRRIVRNDSEIFGLTNDLAQAEAQRALAGLARMRANREYAKTMESIADSADLDARVFGYKSGKVGVTHFREGPLAGKIAPTDFAEPLSDRLKDRGITVNFQGKQRHPMAVIEQFTGTARTLSAGSLDAGWLTIQGGLLLALHPRKFATAAKESLLAIKDPSRRARYIADNYEHVLSFVENGGDIGSSEFVQSLDRLGAFGRIGHAIENKVHGRYGQQGVDVLNRVRQFNPVTRLGSGFNAFTDAGKIELWKSFRGFEATGALTRREITSHINNMLGTLNTRMLGVSPTQRQIEGGLLMFSPRYTRSAFALIGELARGAGKPGTLEGLATRDSMRAIGAFMAGGTFLMWAIGEATNSEVQLNPLKPGWLTAEIGGQKVGISGSMRALADTMFRVVAIASGQNENRDMNALVGFNPLDPKHRRQNPILQYVLGRTPPGVREILTRETFDGQPIESPVQMAGELAKEFLPFAIQAQFFPPPGTDHQNPVAIIPESLGLRARQLSAFERLEEGRNKVASQAFPGTTWEELDNDFKATLRASNPQLQELEEHAHAAGSDFGNYFDRVGQDRAERNTKLTQAANEFRATGNGRTFREKYDEAMAVHREMSARTEREFAEQAAELDERRKRKLADSASDFNRALDAYTRRVKDNPQHVDEFGNPNWDEINKAEKQFRQDVGEELYNRIRQLYLGYDVDGNELPTTYAGEEQVRQLRRAREVLRNAGYWQIADDIVGDDPQAQAIWRWYESSENPAEREAIKRRYRMIARVERIVDRNRQRIRKANPEVDLALMTFYGTRAVSREGRQFEREISRAARAEPLAAG